MSLEEISLEQMLTDSEIADKNHLNFLIQIAKLNPQFTDIAIDGEKIYRPSEFFRYLFLLGAANGGLRSVKIYNIEELPGNISCLFSIGTLHQKIQSVLLKTHPKHYRNLIINEHPYLYVSSLSDMIFHNKELTSIGLDKTSIGMIQEEFWKEKTTFTSVYFNNISMNDRTVENIAFFVKNNPLLASFHFSNGTLSEKGAKILLNAIKKHENLTDLNFDGTSITDKKKFFLDVHGKALNEVHSRNTNPSPSKTTITQTQPKKVKINDPIEAPFSNKTPLSYDLYESFIKSIEKNEASQLIIKQIDIGTYGANIIYAINKNKSLRTVDLQESTIFASETDLMSFGERAIDIKNVNLKSSSIGSSGMRDFSAGLCKEMTDFDGWKTDKHISSWTIEKGLSFYNKLNNLDLSNLNSGKHPNDAFNVASAIASLSCFLEKNSPLRSLSLEGNHLTDNNILTLCEGLKKNENLRTLNLGQNKISVTGITDFIKALKDNHCLEELSLENNNITDKDLDLIYETIKTNKCHLEYIYLDNNPITDKGASSLYAKLKDNFANQIPTRITITNPNISEKYLEGIYYFSATCMERSLLKLHPPSLLSLPRFFKDISKKLPSKEETTGKDKKQNPIAEVVQKTLYRPM